MNGFRLGSSAKRRRVTILDTGQRYMCGEDQHLLKGMTTLGKRGIPSGCHGGGCGVCKVRILGPKSNYRTLSMSRAHITEEEESEGIVLACRTYPLGEIELKVLGKIRKNVLKPGRGYVFGKPIPTTRDKTDEEREKI